jgi:hypothetical protein
VVHYSRERGIKRRVKVEIIRNESECGDQVEEKLTGRRNTYIQQSTVTGLVAVCADEVTFIEGTIGFPTIARLDK